MNTKKTMIIALLAAAFGAAAIPVAARTEVGVQLNFGPPPPYQYEVIPEPRVGFVWAPGYWDWRGDQHVWIAGNWVRERRGYVYEPHRWVEHEGRWRLERGHWDRDRDGRHAH